MLKNINIKAVLGILLLSIFMGIFYNSFSSDGIDFIRNEVIINYVKLGENITENNLRGIDLAQTIKLFNEKSALFIDARDQWDFKKKHITGAINIPEFSFASNEPKLSNISKDQLIIVYCSGDDCDISKRLAVQMSEIGYNNLYVFVGGITAWTEADLPTIKGKDE